VSGCRVDEEADRGSGYGSGRGLKRWLMPDQQLYLLIAIPSGVTGLGILVNVFYFVRIISRMKSFENRLALKY
jgi:hypothetical protein